MSRNRDREKGRDRQDDRSRKHSDRKRSDRSPTTKVNGNLPEDAIFFEKFKFDLLTMRIEWGLLTTSDLHKLQLSKDELSAMLFSQLDLRDTLLEFLGVKLDTLLLKGRVLEEDNRHLKEKICGLQDSRSGKYSNSSVKRERGSGSIDYDSDNSITFSSRNPQLPIKIEKEDCESKNLAKGSKVGDVHSLASEEDKEVSWIKRLARNAVLTDDKEAIKSRLEESNWIKSLTEDTIRGNSSSPSPGEEKIGTSSTKSEDKDAEPIISDKIKAMVAMAFKSQGYGLPEDSKPDETPSDLSKPDENASDSSKPDETVSDLSKPGENPSDRSSPAAEASREESDLGWNTEGEKSISEQVAAVAEELVVKSGYVFQEDLGLYYDHTSGYYYNAETALYYDPKTGTYFYYDHDTQEYKYHSQVPVEERADAATGENVHATGDATSGYPPGSSATISPSLRLMVIETGVDGVKLGTLHMVTINGGKVGRGPRNLVQLDDPCVSEEHAEFIYYSSNATDHHYYVKDLGSELGTLINDVCICPPGEPSDEIEVGHGWELQFGTVKLKCHIHPGYLSCNECEPGLVCAKLPSQSSTQDSAAFNAKNEETRRKVLKAMRKKYALNPYEDPVFNMAKYEDKAKRRQREKGSDNPYEKTEVASTETEIKSSNKGFALMQKMGWSKGEGLGKSQPGIIKPIEPSSTLGRAGLGFGHAVAPPTDGLKKRKKILDVTVRRFNKL